MYIETWPQSYGDKAKLLFSPPNSVIGAMSCLKFYYHMYGATINRLNVFNGNSIVFTRSGQQGNRWLYAEVTVFLQNTVSYLCEISGCTVRREIYPELQVMINECRLQWAEQSVPSHFDSTLISSSMKTIGNKDHVVSSKVYLTRRQNSNLILMLPLIPHPYPKI